MKNAKPKMKDNIKEKMDKGMKKENQRVRLTKRILKETLIQKLKAKDLHEITVTELCSSAEINRTTFYKYYGNVYDVLMDVEGDLMQQGRLCLTSISENEKVKDGVTGPLSQLLNYIKENKEACMVLFRLNCEKDFIDDMLRELHDSFHFFTKETSMDNPEESIRDGYIFKYMIAGSAVIIKSWIQSGTAEPTEYITNLLYDLANSLPKH